MKRSVLVVSISVLLMGWMASPGGAAPGGQRAAADTSLALVQLSGDPLAVSAATRPAGGGRVDFRSAAVRNERARLAAVRNSFRQWLRANAPAARITKELDVAVHAVGVALNGTSLDTLRAAPMVTGVELQQTFRPVAHDDPDLSLVRAAEAWTRVGGPANAGRGVKVAVIDSGIDPSHPCFDDTGYPASPQIGDPDLTNNKVIVARVYGNKVAKDGFDASDQNSHGTHVAGTIACNAHTPAVVEGVDIPYDPSGVAPGATLGSYNVFPGTEGSGRSEDILEAMDDAYEDGFDVANMSLGGARNDGGGAFLLTHAIDNLDRANMVVAVAAGNEGPGYWTVHYPGAAQRALTAGASTVGHNVVNLVDVGPASFEAVFGEFGRPETDLTAPLDVVPDPGSAFAHKLHIACDTSPPLPDLTGKIALLGRGSCDFTVKMRNAQNAGAVGVIMVNWDPNGGPFVMAHNGLEERPTIPGVMISLQDGAVADDHEGASATIRALGTYKTYPELNNVMAGFSSFGPTHGDVLIKPDLVAPGANVLSSVPSWACDEPPCWGFLGGTSMATPHLAGTAALVRGLHPGWTAAQVRSAITNTAQQDVLTLEVGGPTTRDPQAVGAGLLDVDAASAAVVALDPVSVSFGSVPAGSGRGRTASVTVTNLSGSAATFTVSVSDSANDGVAFAGTGGSFTLAAGASRTVTVSATVTRGADDGHAAGELVVSQSGVTVAHAALFLLVGTGDAAPGRHQVPPPFA